ncbi:MAG: 3-dehydroquinate synthase [Gemmatimonadota bacterium]
MSSAIIVNHAFGSYPVHVESGMLMLLRDLIAERLPGKRLVMIADETVNRLYDEWTSGTPEARRLGARASDAGVRLPLSGRLTFPAGEPSKTRSSWNRLTDEMLAANLGRDTAIVALGGGVTGDLAGFVAATYLRGIPFIQVPTTLLAMVDASVGGKVGVNTDLGKNMVGAFYPPALVVADPLTLMSLPEQEYRGGLAEAVKHGLIADREYFEWIASHGREIRARQPAAVSHLVRRSVEIKAAIVSQDEREDGRRAVLNAGHTIAHSLEQASNYRLSHGEAVSIGLVMECRIAEAAGLAESGLAAEVGRVLARFGLPVLLPPDLDLSRAMDAMMMDKKNRGGSIHFAFPAAVGSMHGAGRAWTHPISTEDVRNSLHAGIPHIPT